MDSIDIARRSVRGSVTLFIGNFGATAISAVISILIARLLGPTEYGTYSLILLVPTFLISFLNFGVNTAIIRFSAYSISQGRPEDAKRYTINAIRFLWLNGAILTLVEFLLAGPLASVLLGRPDLTSYVQFVSVTVLGSMFLTTITSTAIGWNEMSLSSTANVAQAVVKLALSPILIVAGFGVAGALAGHMISYVAAGIIGTAILYLGKLRGAGGGGRFLADVKEMLKFGLPLYAGNLTNSLATLFATFVLAYITINANNIFGLYSAAANFVAPVTLVASALTSGLLTSFAAYDGVGGNMRSAFSHAYRFVAFILTPIIFFVLAAAGPLMHLLGASYDAGVPYLRLLALAYLPTAFGYTVHIAYFNGFGRPRLTMALQTAAGVVLFAAAPLLAITAGLGVDGIIYANLLSDLAAWMVGTFFAYRFVNARFDLKANAAILLASLVSCGLTVLIPRVPSSNALTLLSYLVAFGALYLTLAPLLGAVKFDDLDVMEHTFSGLGILSRGFHLLVKYEEYLLSLRK